MSNISQGNVSAASKISSPSKKPSKFDSKVFSGIRTQFSKILQKSRNLIFYSKFSENFKFFLPQSQKTDSGKKQLFFKAREMIINKLDLAKLIKSLDEFEKLKMLLFDQNQYTLFEKIPKTFLVDAKSNLTRRENKKDPVGDEEAGKGSRRSGSGRRYPYSDIFMSRTSFWGKKDEDDVSSNEDFYRALRRIKVKQREKRLNLLDIKLLKLLNLYGDGGKSKNEGVKQAPILNGLQNSFG